KPLRCLIWECPRIGVDGTLGNWVNAWRHRTETPAQARRRQRPVSVWSATSPTSATSHRPIGLDIINPDFNHIRLVGEGRDELGPSDRLGRVFRHGKDIERGNGSPVVGEGCK